MTTLARAEVIIGGDDGPLQNALSRAQNRMQAAGRRLQGIGRTLSTRVTLPLAAVGAASVKMASDAEEAANKFNVVMGDSADRVRARLQELHGTIPLTTTQLEGMASGVQDMLVPLGLARGEAADMSAQMVKVAGDLASFNNVAADVPLEAIQSALAGMSRPLRQFGVDVSQSRLQTLALKEGLIEAGEEMDNAARAQAVMIAVQRDSKDAMGDAARTADSMANSMRFVVRDVKELGITIGQILVPHVRPLVQHLTGMLGRLRNLDPAIQRLAVGAAALVAALGPVALALGTILTLVSPVTVALAGAATVIVGIKQNWLGMGEAAATAWETVMDVVPRVLRPVGSLVRSTINNWIGAWRFLGSVAVIIWEEFIRDPAVDALKRIRAWAEPVLSAVARGFQLLGRIASGAAERIKGFFADAADGGEEEGADLGSRIAHAAVTAFGTDYVGGFMDMVAEGVQRAREMVQRALERLRGMGAGAATEALENADRELQELEVDLENASDGFDTLGEVGSGSLSTLERAVQSVGSNVASMFSQLITGAKSFAETMKETAKQVVADLARMLAKIAVMRALMAAFGAPAAPAPVPGPGALPTPQVPNIPGLAHGGPVQRNRPFLVGERGPELFVPSSAGRVVANDQLGGGPSAGDVAAEVLSRVGGPPRDLPPEAAAHVQYYRDLFAEMVKVGRSDGVDV